MNDTTELRCINCGQSFRPDPQEDTLAGATYEYLNHKCRPERRNP